MIQDEAFRCKGITEKLLDFSRAGRRRSGTTTDLGELVAGRDRHGPAPGQVPATSNIEFVPRTAGRSPPVNAQEIKQVVLNLITNAPRQPRRRRHACGSRSASSGAAGRAASSRDNGCGMTDEVLQAPVRAVLHPPPIGAGHRPGLVDHLSHRRRAWRPHRSRQRRPRPRIAVRRDAARHRRSEQGDASSLPSRLTPGPDPAVRRRRAVAAGADEPRAAADGARGHRLPRRRTPPSPRWRRTPTTASSSISTCRA